MNEDTQKRGWWDVSLGDWHIPTALAVSFWAASAVAVIGYTFKAYKETADGYSSLDSNPPGRRWAGGPSFGVPGNTDILTPVRPGGPTPMDYFAGRATGKPTERGRFGQSDGLNRGIFGDNGQFSTGL